LILTKHFFILLFATITSVCAFGQSDFVIKVSDFDHSVQPGGYFTVLYDVNTANAQILDIRDSLALPSGWTVLTKKVLRPEDAPMIIRFIYTVATSRFASSSEYPIALRLYAEAKLIAYKEIAVSISRIRKIEVIALSQPEYVKEGEELMVEYLIQNSGNTTETFKLNTGRGKVEFDSLLLASRVLQKSLAVLPTLSRRNNEDFKLEAGRENALVEGDSLVMRPNMSQKIIVRQKIPQTDLGYWKASSNLTLTSNQNLATIFTSVSVPVYSTATKKSDPYLRFPVEVGVGYLSYTLGDQVLSGYQYFLRGQGNLDFAKKHSLNFLVSGPSQFQLPTVSSYDQYSVSYSYKSKTFITAGDYLFRLNNLMEFGRFGRGAMVEQHIGKTSIMVFYQKTRFFPNQKDSFGGQVSYRANEFAKVSLSYISKNLFENNSGFRSNLVGVALRYRKKKLSLETEVSAGNAKSKWDLAIFNQFNYALGRFSLSSNTVYAGKNYYGFYKNSVQFVDNLSYSMSRTINIGVNSNISRINPSLDANVYATSPDSKSTMVFASFQPSTRHSFFVNYTQQEREDKQTPAQFHFKEDFGNFSYNLNAPKITLFFRTRYGYAQNLLTPDKATRKQSISNVIQPSVKVLPWLWMGGYLEHQYTSKFSNVDQLQNLIYYGGNVRVSYKKKLNMNFSYRNNYAPDEFFVKRSFMNASVMLDMKHHQLNLTGGRTFLPNAAMRDQNTLFFNAKYALKLNAPLRKNKNLGMVSGIIKGLTNDINPGGILLQLGQQKAITDSEGRFSFTDLVPDKYYLRVLSPLSEKGIIPVSKGPVEVDIRPESKQSIEVAFVKAGSIKGNVVVENSGKDDTLTADAPKLVIIVKLYNDTESFLTLVNDKSEFAFNEVKPGLWNVKEIVKGDQERFEVVNGERLVNLESGNIVQITFVTRLIERKIYFSKQIFNLSSKNKE